MRTITTRLAIAAFAFLAVGCGKDKNVEDYQREKLRQNLGLYQSVAGTYTGIVRSKLDGSVLGAMALELRADTRSTPSNDGQLSIGSPILVGNVRFLDRDIINMAAPDGFYDPGTGLYHADINIPRSSLGGGSGGGNNPPRDGGSPGNGGGQGNPGMNVPAAETITLGGTLSSGGLVGEVESRNYPEYGGRFELVRNGQSIQDLLAAARPGRNPRQEDARRATSWRGNTTFLTDTVVKPVNIVAVRPTYNTAEDFLDLVSPIRVIDMSLNYSQSLHLLYSKAIWDVRQGYITGTALIIVQGQSQLLTTTCRQSGDANLNCTHLTTGRGVTATTAATIAYGDVKDPPDGPENRQSTSKTFIGKGEFAPKDFRKMKLVVTYPARSRLEDLLELFFPISEKLVQASIIFSENTSASFLGVKWDTLSGLLDGSRDSSTPGGGSYVAQIQCHDFYFTKTNRPFSCIYFTNRSATITIDFKPPFTGK
jgi:hypothetical protein